MVTLFNDIGEIEKIEGLNYISEFISAETEKTLIKIIDVQHWQNDLKRRVQHYGYQYDYRARSVSRDSYLGVLPDWLDRICAKLCEQGIVLQKPDQAIINEYKPGQGISPHIDCVPCFGDIIVSLSLGSATTMDFTNSVNKNKISVRLDRRSLVVLSEKARYQWKHSIPARKSDIVNGSRAARERRISITFRHVCSENNH